MNKKFALWLVVVFVLPFAISSVVRGSSSSSVSIVIGGSYNNGEDAGTQTTPTAIVNGNSVNGEDDAQASANGDIKPTSTVANSFVAAGNTANGEDDVASPSSGTSSVAAVSGNSSNGEDDIVLQTTPQATSTAVSGDSANGEDDVNLQATSTVSGGSVNGEDDIAPAVSPALPPSGGSGGGGGGGSFQVGGTGNAGGALLIEPATTTFSIAFSAATSTTSVISATSTAALAPLCISLDGYAGLPGKLNNSVTVSKIQAFLIAYEKANVEINGVYDQKTRTAVASFQRKYSADVLKPWGASLPTGYAYVTTVKKMNEISCKKVRTFTANEIAMLDGFKRSRNIVAAKNTPFSV